MQDQLERDLKTALLSGDKKRVEVLRGLKNSIQYEAVALKIQKSELKDEQILHLLAREAKKRQEAIDLYQKADETERAAAETSEKLIIEQYLPAKLSDSEVSLVVNEVISKLENPGLSEMGKVIGLVKGRLGAQADGAVIAQLVKQKLGSQ